ncbi:MAG: hypothetical protein Q4F44_00950, partial [Bacteroidales bacterium]|nr:hypothetical protein [Bacteroidales bacterium]
QATSLGWPGVNTLLCKAKGNGCKQHSSGKVNLPSSQPMLSHRRRKHCSPAMVPFNAGRWNSCAPELVRFSVIIKDNAAALQTCPRLIMNSTGIEL